MIIMTNIVCNRISFEYNKKEYQAEIFKLKTGKYLVRGYGVELTDKDMDRVVKRFAATLIDNLGELKLIN